MVNLGFSLNRRVQRAEVVVLDVVALLCRGRSYAFSAVSPGVLTYSYVGWLGNVCVKSLRKALLRLVGILRRPGLPGTFRQNRGGHGHSSAAPDGFQRHAKQQWGKESPHRSRHMVRYSTGQQAVSLMFAEGFVYLAEKGLAPSTFWHVGFYAITLKHSRYILTHCIHNMI